MVTAHDFEKDDVPELRAEPGQDRVQVADGVSVRAPEKLHLGSSARRDVPVRLIEWNAAHLVELRVIVVRKRQGLLLLPWAIQSASWCNQKPLPFHPLFELIRERLRHG